MTYSILGLEMSDAQLTKLFNCFLGDKTMRQRYTLTPEQMERILDAGKPVPYLITGGMRPPSPQENANAVWQKLGEEMGFDHWSVRPVEETDYEFTAEPIQPVVPRLPTDLGGVPSPQAD